MNSLKKEFLGYHSEWNLGSPGGWVYQQMAQDIGKIAWAKIRKLAKIPIELDFDDPILNPVSNFANLLLRAHSKRFKSKNPFIVLIAEKETLDKVGENIKIIEYLNTLPRVKAVLADPTRLKLKNGRIYVDNNLVTTIFMDFNNNVIVRLGRRYKLDALLEAIKQGLVTNPRGMEPVGAKGVFEAITGEYKNRMSKTTIKRTPWTRQFYHRKTEGPNGEKISNLIKWVKENWKSLILKPVHGYSGKGIIICQREPDKEKAINHALKSGDYIVQPFIPLDIWTEEFPWIDRIKKKLYIEQWQTDFRCFVTDVGLIGFVTRFGGIPTNVGSGGGVQCSAILRSKIPLNDAVKKINEAILKLGYDAMWKLQQELDKKSVEIGNVYLLGPIKNTLRPRIITETHIRQLKEYAENLWRDAITLEKLWLEGKLSKYVQITEDEEKIARLAPWQGKPALIASDGLFGFRG